MDKNIESMNSVYIYDPNVDTWSSSIPSMQSERYGLEVAMLNYRIYSIREFNREEGGLNTIEVLDLTIRGTQEWRNIASMNTRRIYVGFRVLNGKMFAVRAH